MNRLWFGVALLVLFLAMGIGSMVLLEGVQQPVIGALEEAAEQALSPEPEAAAETALQAKAIWQKSWRGIAAVVPHEPMEEIDGLFARLSVYGSAGLWTEFAACCAQLASMVETIGDTQGLTWWGLL